MNDLIFNLLLLIWMHFIADFVFQTDKVAVNKSKSEAVLLLHVALYIIPFFWFGWFFALMNGVAHYITDYFTSKTTSYLWEKGERHWFFVIVGLDQAIHISTLLITYYIIIGF